MVQDIDQISDLVSERAILSMLINNPNMAYDVFSDLDLDDFVNKQNRTLFKYIRNYTSTKNKINKLNIYMLTDLLKKDGILEQVGGKDYLEALETMNVSPENYSYCKDQLKFSALKRNMYLATLDIQKDCLESKDDINQFIANQEQKIIDVILNTRYTDEVENLAQINEFIEKKRKLFEDNISQGIPTLFTGFDEEYGGLIPKRTYVVCARSKNFKSGFLLNVAVNVAIKQNIPVLYIDLEMSKEPQQSRLLSIVSGVNNDLIENGRYMRYENLTEQVEEAMKILSDKQLYYVRLPSYSIEHVNYLVRKYYKKCNIGLLIFDWIKIPNSTDINYGHERQLLGNVVSMLHDLGEQLNIPVLTAAQLNRSAIGKEELDEGTIAESDRILWFLDYVLFLRWKTEEEIERDGLEEGNLVVQSGSNRYGREYVAYYYVDRIHKTLRLEERKVVKCSTISK